jgi:hypothetical protein
MKGKYFSAVIYLLPKRHYFPLRQHEKFDSQNNSTTVLAVYHLQILKRATGNLLIAHYLLLGAERICSVIPASHK